MGAVRAGSNEVTTTEGATDSEWSAITTAFTEQMTSMDFTRTMPWHRLL